jgi:5'-nucleotidase
MPSGLRARSRSRWVALFAAILALASLITSVNAAIRRPVEIQILNVSDWHGQLDPNSVSVNGANVNIGGAAVLSAYFNADRAANPNTLTLTAGDGVGATPPLSGFFEDIPAIKAMRLMGFDADTFGNHNFDAGLGRLQSQIDLAGSTTEGGKPFAYLSANLRNLNSNLTGVDKMKIFNVGGVKVAVIGITNPEAPGLVFPGNFGTIQITDPVAAANQTRAVARKAGAQVVIALTHMGITGTDANANPSGPLVNFANGLSGFDLVLGDHTDIQYSATINGALVTENKSKGVSYSRTKITVSASGSVTDKQVTFVTPLSAAVTPDQAIVDMLTPYRVSLAVAYDVKIAEATGVFVRGSNVERNGEVPIGDLVADALRATYGTQLALTNGGGIRAPLPSTYAPLDHTLRRTATGYAAGPPYDLVVGDVYAVLPFGNLSLTRNVTGAQLWAALENGVSQFTVNPITLVCSNADGRFPQISGFKFTFKCSAAAGSRVQSVELNDGTPIPNDASVSYSFVTNDFVNAGGDSYTVFKDGQGVTRNIMANDLLEYIKALGALTPTTDGRITKLP